MSLGINSTGNGGQPPVGSSSEKTASGSEKVKASDSSKFSEAVEAKVNSDQSGNSFGSDERTGQTPADSNRLRLPDHSKGATPAGGNSDVPLTGDGLEFIEDLLEPDASSGAHEPATDSPGSTGTGFTGEIQGFNVPIESFGQRVTGTFSAPVKANSTAQGSVDAMNAVSEASENDGAAVSDDVQQETANLDSEVDLKVDSEGNTPAEDVESEPPKPAGTFNFGDDTLAKFLGEGAGDSGSYRRISGFVT